MNVNPKTNYPYHNFPLIFIYLRKKHEKMTSYLRSRWVRWEDIKLYKWDFLVSIIRFYSLKDYKTIDEEEINKKYRFLSI